MADFWVDVWVPPATRQRLLVQAADEAAVPNALGLHPNQVLAVKAVRAKEGAIPATPAPTSATWLSLVTTRKRAHPPINVRLVAQELAVLLDAGVPLLDAVDTLQEKAGSADTALSLVAAALRRGEPLSAALAQAGGAFDALFCALVAASERSGQLAPALRHHAAYLVWSAQLRSRLVASAVYPALLLASGGAVVVFLLLFVLPRFAAVFEGLGHDLPVMSRLLLDLGVAVSAHRTAALSCLAALALAVVLAWQSGAVRQRAVLLAWRVPGLGPRLRTLALARLYRCLGLLAAAGVPIPQALRLAHPVLAAPLQPALVHTAAALDSGQRLSQALQNNGLATPVARRMLRVGEGSGALPAMLERAAAFHDEELAELADLVSRFVNPVLMLVMGTVIGGIVVLMYLPIFTLMEQVP
jgi:general secretion pathway protein F